MYTHFSVLGPAPEFRGQCNTFLWPFFGSLHTLQVGLALAFDPAAAALVSLSCLGSGLSVTKIQ